VPFKEGNESQKHVRIADTRKLRRNATVTGLLSCLEVESLSLPRVALLFPRFALFHSVPRVQLSLIRIIGNRGCVAIASFLGVHSPLVFKGGGAHADRCALKVRDVIHERSAPFRCHPYGGFACTSVRH
jgi:hypothetical protein